MIGSVEYMSMDEAMQFVPDKPTVAISILSPRRAAATLHAEITPVLRLYFEDTTAREDELPRAGVFSEEQARQVIDFIRVHHAQPEPRHLLIHCEAGISRSAAVAVFAASECRLPLTGQFAFLNPWVLGKLVKIAYPHYAF